MSKPRIVCLGEGMVEERVVPDGTLATHYGGDTLNTAIHLARLGCNVVFATAIGTDEESDRLLDAWRAEGLDCALVRRHPKRRTGRYRIAVDALGERSFSYVRHESAARDMFALDMMEAVKAEIERVDLFAYSLITLAILPDTARRQLLGLADLVRAHGGLVAYDGNYRPALWEDTATALRWHDRAIALATIGLPTIEDEVSLRSAQIALDAGAVAGCWNDLGCPEVVVKMGVAGCRLPDGTRQPPPLRLAPVDTSGAGDAFNAGYLAARLHGTAPAEAALVGHRIAGWTIRRPGAMPPADSGEYPSLNAQSQPPGD